MNPYDAALLERWIDRHDAEAFNELVSRYAGLVHGTCRRILRNDADADDVTQDCFLKLARTTSPPRSSLGGWLHSVAVRAALDFVRSNLRRRRREERFASARDDAATDEGAASWKETQEQVDACIAELPDKLREVIVAHFLERRTHDEIARVLDVSRQTVTRRAGIAVERLRRLLARRGVTVSAAALSASLAAGAVHAAPAATLASLGRLALVGTSPQSAVIASSALTIGGSLMAKKFMISAAVACLLFAGGVALLWNDPAELGDVAGDSGGPDTARAIDSVTPVPAVTSTASLDVTLDVTLDNRGGDAGDARDGGTAAAEDATLRGIVVESGDRPVAGALVVAALASSDTGTGEPKRIAETVTGEDGRFELEAAPTSESSLVVAALAPSIGLGASRVPPADAADTAGVGELTIALEPLCLLGGRVSEHETGEGIAGFAIRFTRDELTPDDAGSPDVELARVIAPALFPALLGESGTAVSGADGLFELRAVGPLRVRLGFDASLSDYVLPGFRGGDTVPVFALAPGEERTDIDFALKRGGAISGRALGPDERPLPGARVELIASYETRYRRMIRSDPEGRFRFGGLALDATYQVQAWHGELAPGTSESVAMPVAAEIEGVEVRLAAGAMIQGRFRDEAGAPIVDLSVSLQRVFERRGVHSGYEPAKTDEHGSFELGPVAPGNWVIRPLPREHVERMFIITMPEEGDLIGLDYELTRKSGGTISGRVIDERGLPVRVAVHAWHSGRRVARTTSGEDGVFRLENLREPDGYIIAAFSGEYFGNRVLDVRLHTGDLTIQVARRGRLLGRIVDAATSEPVENFEIRIAFERPDGNRFHRKWQPFTSATGEFEHKGAEPDPVKTEIHVRADGYQPAISPLVAVPPGEDSELVEIALERGAVLGGTIVDARSGEPIPGVRVRPHRRATFEPAMLDVSNDSWKGQDMWKVVMSDERGAFAVHGIKPGTKVNLAIWKDGYSTATRHGVAVGANGATVEVGLSPEARVAVDTSFARRPGEWIFVAAHHRDKPPWTTAFKLYRSTSKPVTLEFPGLPPGRYQFGVYRATKQGRRLAGELRVELAAGETRELSVDVEELERRHASIEGTVSGAEDLSRVGVRATSISPGGVLLAETTVFCDVEGRFELTGLAPGRWTIEARPSSRRGPRPVRKTLELSTGERAAVSMALTRAGR